MRTTLLLLLLGVPVAKGAVLGIDLGGEYIKASLVKPRVPLDIVVNPEGRRRTDAVVGFFDGEQVCGKAALGQQSRRPANFVSYLKMLIGKGQSSANRKWLADTHYPHNWTEVKGAGTLQVRLGSTGLGDGMDEYTVVELFAMLLTRQREDAEAMAEEPIKDVVLTVPPFWAQDERQALLDAAELAGMKVLGLMNENSAVAMKYAIDKKYDASKEHNVIFYDMGSTSVKASLVTFFTEGKGKKEQDAFKVKAVAWDEGCGGHIIDARLATRFAKEFDKKHGVADGSVEDSPRAMARLRVSAKKIKETLTANKETPVSVEALKNDIDFRSHITREQFDEMHSDLWERAIAPVQKLLDDSGMATSDIHAAVIVGGCSLIPSVQENLKSKLGLKELTRSMDVYEAAALGAGFYAAGLSPSFRVRQVGVTDLYPFGVSVHVGKSNGTHDDPAKPTEHVFEPKETIPNTKYLMFTRDGNFTVDLKYSNPDVLPRDADVGIGSYNLTRLSEKCAKFNTTDKPTVTLQLQIDRNGMATLAEATASVTEWTEKQIKIARKKVKKEDAGANKTKVDGTDSQGDGSASNDTATNAKAADEAETDSAPDDDDDTAAKKNDDGDSSKKLDEQKKRESCSWNATASVTVGEGTNATEVGAYIEIRDGETYPLATECTRVNAAYEGEIVLRCNDGELSADTTDCTPIQYEARLEKVVQRVKLKSGYLEHGISKLSKAQLGGAKSKLDKIRKVMAELQRLAQSKNDVEAHIFETRDALEYNDELKAVMIDEQMDTVRAGLSEAEEWLWDDHTYSEYVEKLYALRDELKPALTRKEEAMARPEALERCHKALDGVQKKLDNATYMLNMPANETKKLTTGTAEFGKWLADKEAEQKEKAAHEEPAFMASEVVMKVQMYEKAMAAAMAKKPKARKKKEKKNTTSTSAEEDAPPERVWTAAEHFDILQHFYNTVDPENPKSESDIKAIIAKRIDEDETELRPAQFKVLCHKLENRYDKNPFVLWQEKLAKDSADGTGEESGKEKKDKEEIWKNFFGACFDDGAAALTSGELNPEDVLDR
eukprot:COSAG01_NODE_4859_length_4677_cov_7.521407_2_plen_1059_part_01